MKNYKNLSTEEKTEFTNFFNQVTIGDCENKGVDFVKLNKVFKNITQVNETIEEKSCYKDDITNQQNYINKLVNTSLADLNPNKLREHMNILSELIERQSAIQEYQIQKRK